MKYGFLEKIMCLGKNTFKTPSAIRSKKSMYITIVITKIKA